MRNYYKHGEYNAICDVCGFRYKSSDLIRRWDNAYVCKKDFEVRHPQDLIKVRNRTHIPSWTRPETTPQFITANPLLWNNGVLFWNGIPLYWHL